LCGPADVWRSDCGTARLAFGIRQAEPADEFASGPRGLLDESRVDVFQTQLGAAEQMELSVVADFAPGKTNVAVAPLASNEGSSEVEPILARSHGYVESPAARWGIPRDEVKDCPRALRDDLLSCRTPRAKSHVDVLVPPALGVWPAATSWKINAFDNDDHSDIGPGSHG